MDFFSLGELFIGNGMGLWGLEINPNTFGNMTHPRGGGWIKGLDRSNLVDIASGRWSCLAIDEIEDASSQQTF